MNIYSIQHHNYYIVMSPKVPFKIQIVLCLVVHYQNYVTTHAPVVYIGLPTHDCLIQFCEY
jgi:hypothetical protein